MKHLIIAMVGAVGIASAVDAALILDRTTLDDLLGGNQTLEDFESFVVAQGGAATLDVFELDFNTIANGQGPGLVEPGASYLNPSETSLQWNGDQYFGLETKTLVSAGESIELVYDSEVTAMGVDLRAFEGFGYDGVFDVYDTDDTLLGSVSFNLANGGAENVFLGWEHAGGIGRVVLHSPLLGFSPIIDNHGYGRVPAPGAIALLGLAGLVRRRRR
jgi:hypothetical protein